MHLRDIGADHHQIDQPNAPFGSAARGCHTVGSVPVRRRLDRPFGHGATFHRAHRERHQSGHGLRPDAGTHQGGIGEPARSAAVSRPRASAIGARRDHGIARQRQIELARRAACPRLERAPRYRRAAEHPHDVPSPIGIAIKIFCTDSGIGANPARAAPAQPPHSGRSGRRGSRKISPPTGDWRSGCLCSVHDWRRAAPYCRGFLRPLVAYAAPRSLAGNLMIVAISPSSGMTSFAGQRPCRFLHSPHSRSGRSS